MKVKKFTKKVLNIFLAFSILVSQFSFPIWNMTAKAEGFQEESAKKYFYNQLDTNNQRIFYAAMEDMLAKGFFKEGNVSVEVAVDTSVGEDKLLKDMGAARDAFMLDYPELFYVDFDYLSIRVTSDGTNKQVYLGTGRGDNYINKEFLNMDGSINRTKLNDAINNVNNRIKDIVKDAEGKSINEQIRIAHDAVIRAAAYKYEYQTDHPYSVRTIYGVFGLGSGDNTGAALCEGYARALKSILDRLGINSILVRGVYDTGSTKEEHMWVYVKVDGNWYGVDPTFDNTDSKSNGVEKVNTEFLMADAGVMRNHIPIGVISTSDFQFDYPELYGGSTVDNTTYTEEEMMQIVYKDAYGLVIKDTGKTAEDNQDKTPYKIYHVSFNGKGFKKAAAEDGKYMIFNAWQNNKNASTGEEKRESTGLTYVVYNGTYGEYFQESEDGDYTIYTARNVDGFQVGITDVPNDLEEPSEQNLYNAFYESGPERILDLSSDIVISTEARGYPAPYVKRTSPATTLKQRVGKTYHVVVEYDQDMQIIDGEELWYELQLFDFAYGYREPNEETMMYKIEHLEFDGKRTITYDFTPSRLWSLDETLYIVQFTGIKGIESGKKPNKVEYAVGNAVTGCIYSLRAMGVDKEAYAKPTLMDDIDDISEYINQDELGIDNEWLQKYGDLLTNRLSLVTTDPSATQHNDLTEQLESDALPGRGILGVKTYNIWLSLCGKQLAELVDGMKLKIMIGFPEGYTYSSVDEGVTFQAYHYKTIKDAKGNVIKDVNGNATYEIEKIDVTVTELGLIIYVNSFSPFAIVALNGTSEEIKDAKANTITIRTNDGGSFDSDTIFTLNNGESKTVNFTANEGYTIEKILVGNEVIDLSGEGLTTYALKLSTKANEEDAIIINGATTISVSYIANNTGMIGNPATGEIEEQKPIYKFISGTVYEFNTKTDDVLQFRLNIPYETFTELNGKVYVDGNLVDSEYYKVTEGSTSSTTITFTDEFIKTLTIGEHTIKVTLNDDYDSEVTTTFNVTEKSSNNESGNTGNSGSNNVQTSVMDVRLYIALAIGALIGIIYIKRKKIA